MFDINSEGDILCKKQNQKYKISVKIVNYTPVFYTPFWKGFIRLSIFFNGVLTVFISVNNYGKKRDIGTISIKTFSLISPRTELSVL